MSRKTALTRRPAKSSQTKPGSDNHKRRDHCVTSDAAQRFVGWLLCSAAAVGEEAEQGEGSERDSGGLGDALQTTWRT